MDYTAVAMAVISALLSIGVVSVFLAKYMPQVLKYAMIAKDATETLADVAAALKDGNLTQAEIDEIKADVIKFQADLRI